MKYLCVCLLLLIPHTALANDTDHITRVETYLNKIDTIIADFTQIAPDGALTGGKFYLKRPGKMRWQYDPPTPILMVANGDAIIFYDYELEQISHIPLDNTLAGFLAQEVIDFDDQSIQLTGFDQSPGSIRLSLVQRGQAEDGELTLEFIDNPIQIKNMIIRDAQGKSTTISLQNARYGHTLEENLFTFRDPRTRLGKDI